MTAQLPPSHQARFYGPFARFARWLFRLFSRRYQAQFPPPEGPTVYVCRHLNMHGPYTTLKWLPFQVHPFSLHVFFSDGTAVALYRDYTFSVRQGKQPSHFSLRAWISGHVPVRLLRSFRAIPVHRDAQAIRTMRTALKYLERGESLIIWPDMAYTKGYEAPCQIYNGFLYLGELYQRRTGQVLPFVPLYIDDANRRILAQPVQTVTDYQQQKEAATQRMAAAIDRPLTADSAHTKEAAHEEMAQPCDPSAGSDPVAADRRSE